MHPQDRVRLDMIEKHGFCFNPVFVNNTTLVYTAGLFRTFHHPEIFVMGYEAHHAFNLIGMVFERIKGGDRFADAMVIDDLLEGDLFAIRPLLQSSVYENSGIGQRFVGEFPGVQLFFSDENCLFPWDEGCDPRSTRLQTSLLQVEPVVPARKAGSLKLN
jgi:hypothetical protein